MMHIRLQDHFDKIENRFTMLAEREARIFKDAFDKQKELTDRALKLAEVGRPPVIGNCQLMGLAALGGRR